LIFYFDLNASHVSLAVATNFRSRFYLSRAMRAGFAADECQIFRKREEGCERQRAQTGRQNYFANSEPHGFIS
jgi:hypothetical protein